MMGFAIAEWEDLEKVLAVVIEWSNPVLQR